MRRRIGLGLSVLFLGYEVLSVGLAGALAERGAFAPALAIRPDLASVASGRAEAALAAGDPVAADSFARAALAQSPQDARALRIIGLAAEARGRIDAADAAMSLGARLGWHDTATQQWLFKQGLLRADFVTAAQSGDALARMDRMRPQTFQLFWLMASQTQGSAALAGRLEEEPNWRPAFLLSAGQYLRGAQGTATMQTLLAAMRRSTHPATTAELGAYFDAAVRRGEIAQAYSIWHALAAPHGLLYDGGFDRFAAQGDGNQPIPFEWQPGGGAMTVTAGSDPANPALEVDSHGQGGIAVSQTVMLAPGAYRLTARMGAPPGAAGDAFDWVVKCLPGRTDVGVAPARRGGVDFDVPATGCPAQSVVLRVARVGAIGGDTPVRFDDAAIALR